ncbi:UvrB/uvrC motif-containing protein [Ruminococcaceae bacterium YRB3002]|nr:UvrB/uvrC motif-containing protein [Ruminococcaceae bacterium YRB3002]
MRCARCGRLLSADNAEIVDRSYLCRDCARAVRMDSFMDLNAAIIEDIRQTMMAMDELEFSNNDITCSSCGMTLKEFEESSRLGCLSCYNAFANEIGKRLLKMYGDESYCGREPGTRIDYDYLDSGVTGGGDEDRIVPEEDELPFVPVNGGQGDQAAGTPEQPNAQEHKDITERIAKSDLGMLSDDQLRQALKKAISKEDYKLAARIRDELNSRKGGSDDE